MTLPVSPNPISLSQVNVDLNKAANALISLNDSVVRSLFGVPSGTISLSQGYGKKANYSINYVIVGGGGGSGGDKGRVGGGKSANRYKLFIY